MDHMYTIIYSIQQDVRVNIHPCERSIVSKVDAIGEVMSDVEWIKYVIISIRIVHFRPIWLH